MLLRILTGLALIGLVAEAGQDPWQGRGRGRGRRFEPPAQLEATIAPNFSFARVQFQSVQQRRNPGWSHDYPRAERNFLKILAEVSSVYTEPAAHTIVPLASDEIMRYPVLYFSEPGTWAISQEEVENFRSHLARGGFAIFDDFDGPWDWENFEACMALVLPGRHFELIPVDDPLFQSFFHIKSLELTNPTGRLPPEFWGIRDEAGRVQVIANFNNDIGEYWEWSDHGYYPIELSNEGYKLGVNYIIYALTH